MDSVVRPILTGLAALFFAVSPMQAADRFSVHRNKTTSNQKAMSKASDYVDKYAEAAMEQMRKYGIPASVTLAQGILESASGQSELSRKGNNHFGIKASQSWLNDGGRYLVYSDDKPNEKFCRYASVTDSYEHHSLFLKGNKRYANLFELSPDDYVGWTRGLQEDGYATSKQYASSLQSLIRTHGLDKYDRIVMQEKGWKSTLSQTGNTAELAANSRSIDDSSKIEQVVGKPELVKEEVKTEQQDKDFFNTILPDTSAAEDDPWKNFFGLLGQGGYPNADPVVEIASTLFAGLMSMALQIDNMGNTQAVQQTASEHPVHAEVNALASQNFENAMNSMNNNPIKRTRS